jgi:dimethylhistidine N-methyltransferase
MIEFGSGSSVKTRLLISAALAKQLKLDYAPVDISREFLVRSANDLLDTFPTLAITAIAAEYLDAVAHLPEADHPRLILFLGSNIGNFTREEAICFLSTIQSVLKPHDRILLGADLVKNRDVLHAAYNDASGLTAEFNFNLLRRINQDLNAKFDLDSFRHSAPFDESNSRIEMQLICTKPHSVFVEDLDTVFEFKEGEIVTTEFSHKYTPESIAELAQAAGLTIERQWTDDLGYFGEFLMGKELHG